MPNNYSRQTYDRHPDKIERNHLCPLCSSYVMPFLGVLGTEHKGHCPKCGTVTYVSMPETVTHEFTSYVRAELAAEEHKALKIVLDVTAPKPEQTYQEFQTIAAKYAPKPFTPKANCQHEKEYATINGMFCRDCHQTREAVTDFEKRLVSKLTPRNNGYVNYGRQTN